MATSMPHLSRQMLVSLAGVLIAVMVAISFALFLLPRSSSTAFAATFQKVTGTTCVQAPTIEHCNNQDPEWQGCAADAQTLEQADIKEHGITIGKIELRWSLKCYSWWGRVFDMRAGSQANMHITIAGTTISAAPSFIGAHYRILYSPMVFDASPTQASPAITGMLTINSVSTPANATIPAIMVPKHQQQKKGA